MSIVLSPVFEFRRPALSRTEPDIVSEVVDRLGHELHLDAGVIRKAIIAQISTIRPSSERERLLQALRALL